MQCSLTVVVKLELEHDLTHSSSFLVLLRNCDLSSSHARNITGIVFKQVIREPQVYLVVQAFLGR